MVLVSTLDEPAWRAMSHGAQMLYIALKRRYWVKSHNNGKLFLSQRTAAKELSSHHNQIARWFRELQHYGFIKMTKSGYLGVEGKGRAPRWQLTELGCMNEHPTRDFTLWDGTKFKDQKAKPRAGKPAPGVRESRHTSVQENHAVERKSVREIPHMAKSKRVQENQHRSTLPYVDAVQPATPTAPAAPTAASQLQTRTVRPRTALLPLDKPSRPRTPLHPRCR